MFSTKPCGVCDTSSAFLIEMTPIGITSIDVISNGITSIKQGSLHIIQYFCNC